MPPTWTRGKRNELKRKNEQKKKKAQKEKKIIASGSSGFNFFYNAAGRSYIIRCRVDVVLKLMSLKIEVFRVNQFC